MGIWNFVNSGTDAVIRNVPDLTTVKDACKISYGCGAAAITKIDKAVRVDGLQRIISSMPDEKSREQIGLFASKFAQNAASYAAKEGLNWVPGGKAFSEIVSNTIRDVKSENQCSNQENVSKKEIFGGNGKSQKHSIRMGMLEGMEMQGQGVQSSLEKPLPSYANEDKKPEDILRVFMMKEFIGCRFLDDLLIPQNRRGKGTTN